MALACILIGILLGIIFLYGIQVWWTRHKEAVKEREQKARGRVPDKYLPPHLREDAQPQALQESIVNRRMSPRAWQNRQEEIISYWMEHPEERPDVS